MPTNRLYLSVLPMIHISGGMPANYARVRLGLQQPRVTEQVLTLFPDRSFATEFYPDEVQLYIRIFRENADQFLTGGHVTYYTFTEQPTDDGRVVVMVEQHVS